MNFSNYTKETFTPKLIDLYNKRWKSEKKSQKAFAEAMNALYEKYDIRDRSGEEQRTCTHQQVSQWLNGTFPDDENLRCICEILGVDPEHFTSPTEDELYKFSSDYMTDIGENKILPYCEEVGLDPHFVVVISDLFGEDLGEQFPFWTQLIRNPKLLCDPSELYIRPDPVDFWSSSAEMKPDVKMFQIEVKNQNGSDETKRITLSYSDLLFLRDVQDEVKEYIEFLFLKRKKELQKECEEASKKAQIPQPNGGYALVQLKAEDLNKIDKYCDRYVDNRVKIEIRRRKKDGND